MSTMCKTILIATVIMLLQSPVSAADTKYLVIPAASSTTCDGPDEVISGGGRCWMNRNLGAIQVATSLTDSDAYGDLYQWGRRGEGHQNRTSPTTTVRSGYDVSWYRAFIKTPDLPFDWRNPPNHKLWQGLSGINNPCPQEFRIPTRAEWDAEIASWDSEDAAGAFASPLKLPVAGYRNASDGAPINEDRWGYYWSSTVNNTTLKHSYALYINDDNAYTAYTHRSYGYSVRCIKD